MLHIAEMSRDTGTMQRHEAGFRFFSELVTEAMENRDTL
jgi:hypothetical protein